MMSFLSTIVIRYFINKIKYANKSNSFLDIGNIYPGQYPVTCCHVSYARIWAWRRSILIHLRSISFGSFRHLRHFVSVIVILVAVLDPSINYDIFSIHTGVYTQLSSLVAMIVTTFTVVTWPVTCSAVALSHARQTKKVLWSRVLSQCLQHGLSVVAFPSLVRGKPSIHNEKLG